MVYEGLANYEKNQQASPSSLFGTLMILKAACVNNNSYIDLLITPFMKVLHRLAKEHLQPVTPESSPSKHLSLTILISKVLIFSFLTIF